MPCARMTGTPPAASDSDGKGRHTYQRGDNMLQSKGRASRPSDTRTRGMGIAGTAKAAGVALACAIAMVSGTAAFPTAAHADELSDATEQVQAAAKELQDATDAANALQSQMDEAAKSMASTQDRQAVVQGEVNDTIRANYKARGGTPDAVATLTADSIDGLASLLSYDSKTEATLANNLAGISERTAELKAQSDDLLSKKQEQDAKVSELRSKKADLDKKVSDLKAKAAKEEADRKAAAAAQAAQKAASTASSEASSTAQTFATDTSTGGWQSGRASAYGGSSDPGAGSRTANGSTVNDYSMGVAIPLAWGRRDLLGHQVEISYGGRSVIATINDLGGMGGGSRALDLQPGVFKALGAGTCNAWGVRTVQYRIL